MNLNEDTFSNLRDKVADIKYDTQQVLDRIDSLDAAYQERTGLEQSLEREVTVQRAQVSAWKKEVDKLKLELQRQQDLSQKYYNNVETLAEEVNRLRSEKEASSGPCGCQAYRDLEERATMPVIPKDVAIAIFREGVQSGINDAVAELEGQSITIEESEYCGDFEVSFSRRIDLDNELDLDWMRGKVGQYEESFVVDALKGLCAGKEFECRIQGIDNDNNKQNTTT